MCLARAYSRQVDVEVSAGFVHEYFLRHFCPASAVTAAFIFQNRPNLPEAYRACGYLGQVDGYAVCNMPRNKIRHDNKRVALDERQQYMAKVVRLELVTVFGHLVRMRLGGSAT